MYPVNNYLYPHPRLANFPPNSLPQYYSYPQYVTSPNVIMQPHQQQRPNGSASHLQSTQLSSSVAGSVSGATTTPLPHQQNSHQQQLAGIPQLGAQGSHHQMSTPLYQIPAAMQRSTPDNKKRQRNPIPIIDPNSGEAILVNNKSTTSSHSSSSNTHSAALKIEAPMSPPIAVSPAGNTTAIESDISDIPHVQSDFEPMMNVGDPTYTCETEVANVDEQPHTPIVSANADGPSVDITPKPSKNVKRAWVSPQWSDHLLRFISFIRLFRLQFFNSVTNRMVILRHWLLRSLLTLHQRINERVSHPSKREPMPNVIRARNRLQQVVNGLKMCKPTQGRPLNTKIQVKALLFETHLKASAVRLTEMQHASRPGRSFPKTINQREAVTHFGMPPRLANGQFHPSHWKWWNNWLLFVKMGIGHSSGLAQRMGIIHRRIRSAYRASHAGISTLVTHWFIYE